MSLPHSPAKLELTTASKGAALQKLVSSIVTCQQSLQQQGMKLGSVSQKGNSFWGVLRLINEQGPLTVPQIALHRRVSRQAIQVMMDEYVNEGYLQFKENPHHKRSKLVGLTPMGLNQLTKLSDIIFSQLDKTAKDFKKEDLITAVNVLAKLQNLLNDVEEQ